MYTVRVKCAPVPRQRVHPILQWRKPGHNPGVCYEYHTEFAHSRKPAYARPPFCGGSNPSQSAIAMGAYRFISLGIIKCPAGGHFIIPGGARNLLPLAYEKPAPNTRTKGLKTGKNREFLQKTAFFRQFYTT